MASAAHIALVARLEPLTADDWREWQAVEDELVDGGHSGMAEQEWDVVEDRIQDLREGRDEILRDLSDDDVKALLDAGDGAAAHELERRGLPSPAPAWRARRRADAYCEIVRPGQ